MFDKKTAVILILGALPAALEVSALGQRQQDNLPPSLQESGKQNLISDLDNREYDTQGNLLRRVRAQLAVRHTKTDIVDLDKPRVTGNSRGQNWAISALNGKLYPDERGLELSDQVVLERWGGNSLPATVRADFLQWFSDSNIVVWKGNVELTEAGFTISGDELKVWDRNDQDRGFEVQGMPARFQRYGVENASGEAQRMTYDAFTRYMVMLGDASLTQDDITVSGPRLQYFPRSGRTAEELFP